MQLFSDMFEFLPSIGASKKRCYYHLEISFFPRTSMVLFIINLVELKLI